jgi:2-oxoglutarate dehydrogenase E1 component
VIDDGNAVAKEVTRLVFCCGKIYFDLLEVQLKKKIRDTALVRIEQLHPYPDKQVKAIMKKYKGAKIVWVQEEPVNMGYWSFIQRMMPKVDFEVVSRKASASPSTGYSKIHKIEQEKIINKTFSI